MSFLSLTTLLLIAFLTLSRGQRLYAADSGGNLTTLFLSPSTRNLSIIARSSDCGPNASDLQLDSANRILYCVDRGTARSVNGSINSFEISESGTLTRVDREPVPSSGVSSGIFGTGDKRAIISVSFNRSAVAVVGLGEKGAFTSLLSTSHPQLAGPPGPFRNRQDQSYLHHVILDPTGKLILVPDIGADLVRVYSFDPETLALTEQEPLETDSGVGPRHGLFWRSDSGELYFLVNGDLSQKVYTYAISYNGAGLSWTKVSEIVALGNDNEKPAQTAPSSEIALSPDNKYIVVSNRDISFAGSIARGEAPSTEFGTKDTDTLSTFSIGQDGHLTLIQLSPSGGWSPRQFAFNKIGDMIAVGHQNNNTVVIWKRDLATGKIIDEAQGGKVAVQTLTGPVVMTVWDE